MSRPSSDNTLSYQAIEAYYTAHRDELLAFVSSRLQPASPLLRGGARGGGEEAEDIVQNTFLRLLTSDKMITEVTLPALVYTTARNLIIDYYRRRTTFEAYEHVVRRSVAAADEVSATDAYGMQEQESVFSAWEMTELLERGLTRVPENCREIYRMHIYGGMKVSEISYRLGEGYKSVEHRLGTARKVVRQFMRKYA